MADEIRLQETVTGSPTGMDIVCAGGNPVPASPFEVTLWRMLEEARERVRRLEQTVARLKEGSD